MALANISLHLSLIESEVPGARGKVLSNVLGVTSEGSLLLLELLLELLWEEEEMRLYISRPLKLPFDWCQKYPNICVLFVTFLLWPLGFPVKEKRQVLFVLSSFHLKVSLHHQAHLDNKCLPKWEGVEEWIVWKHSSCERESPEQQFVIAVVEN